MRHRPLLTTDTVAPGIRVAGHSAPGLVLRVCRWATFGGLLGPGRCTAERGDRLGHHDLHTVEHRRRERAALRIVLRTRHVARRRDAAWCVFATRQAAWRMLHASHLPARKAAHRVCAQRAARTRARVHAQCECVCARARVCVRACVHACMRASVCVGGWVGGRRRRGWVRWGRGRGTSTTHMRRACSTVRRHSGHVCAAPSSIRLAHT